MSEFNPQTCDLRQLISEVMEARMQTREAILQLQAKLRAVPEIRAAMWPGHYTGKLERLTPVHGIFASTQTPSG